MSYLLPCSAIVPTKNRRDSLHKMLISLAQQSFHPYELIVIDASSDEATFYLCKENVPNLETKIIYSRASETGAAAQRNTGITYATQDTILFMDDDIIFDPDCLHHLWAALQSDINLGGVNAMIINQQYIPPGKMSRLLFRIMSGDNIASYAGKCIGPALNLLPEDSSDLPEVVPVEWLNLGCTLYRREALPHPPFLSWFKGYSLMEDLALSLTVGKKWKLANARTARIYHDSQPGLHKANLSELAKMELINRHYIMTYVLGRKKIVDYLKLYLLEIFGLVTSLTTAKNWTRLPLLLRGKFLGAWIILYSIQNSPKNIASKV